MKKISTALILFAFVFGFSQSDINGIGRFKIGMDVSIIDSLKNEGYVYKIFDKEKDRYYTNSEEFALYALSLKDSPKKQKANRIIFEKQKSNNLSEYGEYPFIDGKKTFIVKYYNVANIDIHYMKLDFYKDKLYHIDVDNNLELTLALRSKYKSTDSQETGKKTVCSNAYRQAEYQDITYKYTYRDGDIRAYSSKMVFYYNCEQHEVTTNVIHDRHIGDDVFKMEKEIFMSKYNDPNREELKTLKKL